MNIMLHRAAAPIAAAVLLALVAPAHAQSSKPQPQPSLSPAAVGNSQSSQLPAGTDTGVPGNAQNPKVTGNLIGGDNTRRGYKRMREEEEAGPAIDDSAAAKLAARGAPKGATPASAASAPTKAGPSPKRSPPGR